jgi:phenylacetate-CoA ligase
MIRGFLTLKIHERNSREKILRIQDKKFRKILKFAYKNSKFYHDLYKSKGISEEELDNIPVEKIPVVDKETLMENFDDVLTVDDVSKKEVLSFLDESKHPNDLLKNKYHVIHSSGSSGKLGLFLYSKKEWDSIYPYITKAYDFNFRKNRSVFIGAAGGHFAGASFSSWGGKGIPGLFNEPLILNVNEPIDQIIKKLNDFKPTILGGYFNALKILAQKKEQGLLKIDPKIVVNCGEGLNPKDKEFIVNVFDASMSNLYSFAECIVLGFGKEEYDGIYLFDDLAKIEFKKDHIIVTNLYNKTEPIIRYRIDDYISPKKDKKNKYPFTLVNEIIGRAEFIIWFKNEDGNKDFIHPLIFTDFFVKGLDKHQIVITGESSFIFKAAIKSDEKKRVLKEIDKKLEKILLDKNFSNVEYQIKEVDEIPVNPKTGKYKLVIDEKKN